MVRFYYLLSLLTPQFVFAQNGFVDVAENSGVEFVACFSDWDLPAQGGVAWFDFDADGDEDIYLTGGAEPDGLFKNNGDGSFTDVTEVAGFDVLDTVNTMGVVTADIDNDGFREVFITTEETHANRLFYNNGDGSFTDISDDAGVRQGGNSASACFGDFNEDGFLDLYVTNWCIDFQEFGTVDTLPAIQNYLYINNGDLTFDEKAYEYGVADDAGCGLAATFSDYDNDGDVDLILGNDFGTLPGNSGNKLFENQFPLDTFYDVSSQVGFDLEMMSMGTAVGDYNEDGFLDYYITNEGNDALLKNANGQFTHETSNAGLENLYVTCQEEFTFSATYGWGCGFLDYDLDSRLDLFVVNGSLHWEYPEPCFDECKLYRGGANTGFIDVSAQQGVNDPYMSRGAAFADYDQDGDIDILLGITDSVNGNANVRLFENQTDEGNWLEIVPTGVNGNRDGFGARVVAIINNRKLIREVDGGSGFNSHHSSIVHFGLGNHQVVDTLQITWLNGHLDEFYHIPANVKLEITEGQGMLITNASAKSTNNGFIVYPNPVSVGETVTIHGNGLTAQLYNISLFGIDGKRIDDARFDTLKDGVDLGNITLPQRMAAGTYLLQLQCENQPPEQQVLVVCRQ